MRRRTRSAFTLIELLVVAALIAILAAILFPVFALVREKVRLAACISNAKQMGTALQMYVQDYDEVLPLYADDLDPRVPNGNPLGYWHNMLQPYVKNYQVFICPSAQTTAEKTIDTGEGDPDDRLYLRERGSGSYGYNYYYLGANPQQMFALAQVTHPSETIAIAEINRTVHPAVVYPAPMTDGLPAWLRRYSEADRERLWQQFAERHQGGNVLVFVDGHAKWRRRSAVEGHPQLFVSMK